MLHDGDEVKIPGDSHFSRMYPRLYYCDIIWLGKLKYETSQLHQDYGRLWARKKINIERDHCILEIWVGYFHKFKHNCWNCKIIQLITIIIYENIHNLHHTNLTIAPILWSSVGPWKDKCKKGIYENVQLIFSEHC
jgi:hypothetical protein